MVERGGASASKAPPGLLLQCQMPRYVFVLLFLTTVIFKVVQSKGGQG